MHSKEKNPSDICNIIFPKLWIVSYIWFGEIKNSGSFINYSEEHRITQEIQ